jgi:NADH-quinone oxidoreductase subunit B
VGVILGKLAPRIEQLPGGAVMIGSFDTIINWSRANSLWPLAFGTKCCAIEMLMATGAAHQDMSRFGAEVARQTPRQADFMVIAGAIVKKMAMRVRMLYEQMAEPRYVMATGSCAISGGPFMYNSYTMVRGVDELLPVDVYVPGCPPRPEAFFWGLLTLQRLIKEGQSIRDCDVRRKPVLSALPQGITMADIQEQVQKALVEENVVNVNRDVDEKIWTERLKQWIAKYSYKP